MMYITLTSLTALTPGLKGLQSDVVYLGRPIAPTYTSPGGKGGVAGSKPMRTAVHRSPNKLWRSSEY